MGVYGLRFKIAFVQISVGADFVESHTVAVVPNTFHDFVFFVGEFAMHVVLPLLLYKTSCSDYSAFVIKCQILLITY